MLNTYQIWNIQRTECDTYEELTAKEEEQGYSFSSFITTDNIADVVQAIENETDATMGFELIPQPIRVELYKHCDAGYRESIEDGAINVLNTAGIFSTNGKDYAQLLHNAWSTADSLGRADDLSYVTFDSYGNFLDCGQLEYKLIK